MNDGFLLVAARNQHIAEARPERPYDERSAATIYHWNGTKIESFHRGFCGAAAREVLEVLCPSIV